MLKLEHLVNYYALWSLSHDCKFEIYVIHAEKLCTKRTNISNEKKYVYTTCSYYIELKFVK